jgi:UDP-N-acetylglucosamine kinase
VTAGGSGDYVLPNGENARIFASQIVPQLLAGATAQPDPRVVFVIGQPGAGKTATTRWVRDILAERGLAGLVNSDIFKPYHPDYNRLMLEDDQTAAALVSEDGRRWTAHAEAYLIDRRADIVIETTCRNPAVLH